MVARAGRSFRIGHSKCHSNAHSSHVNASERFSPVCEWKVSSHPPGAMQKNPVKEMLVRDADLRAMR